MFETDHMADNFDTTHQGFPVPMFPSLYIPPCERPGQWVDRLDTTAQGVPVDAQAATVLGGHTSADEAAAAAADDATALWKAELVG